MGGDLTTATCTDNGRGSRIVLLDENVDQSPGASGTSTQAAGREDRVIRGCFIAADVADAHDLDACKNKQRALSRKAISTMTLTSQGSLGVSIGTVGFSYFD